MQLSPTATSASAPARPLASTPPRAEPTADERTIVGGMGAERTISEVSRLGGPRVAGTPGALRAAELIRDTAAANGWAAHIEDVPMSGGRLLHNVVAEKRGTAADGERGLVLAGAHLDSVPRAYGANDDGSGTAALMEATRVFTDVPTRHDLRFVWFDGEELGLVGSRAYVRQHADELKGAKAMVVAEMLGSPDGRSMLVFTDRKSADAAAPAREAARRNGIEPEIEIDPRAGSDHLPFAAAGIPSLVVATAAPRTIDHDDPNYHRPTDTADKLNPTVMEQAVDLLGVAINAYANGD